MVVKTVKRPIRSVIITSEKQNFVHGARIQFAFTSKLHTELDDTKSYYEFIIKTTISKN